MRCREPSVQIGENSPSCSFSASSDGRNADRAALDELLRVTAPGGKLFILINLYSDNHYSLRWVKELKVPVQALSEAEYLALLRKHGFTSVEARRIPDRSPTPETYSGKWFKNAEELREFKRIGALLLIGEKPR